MGLAAAGMVGCTRESAEPNPPSAPATVTTPADPDARLRADTAASETALIAVYREAIAAHPGLAAELELFVVQHEAHLARVAPGHALGSNAPVESGSTPASTPPNGPSPATDAPTAPPSGSAIATSDASASAVLGGLADAEVAAQVQRATACDGARDPALARDLCLIAASEAQHAAALGSLAAQASGP